MKTILMMTLLSLGQTLAFAQEDNVRDGNWWRDLERTDKAAFALGFYDGINLGYNYALWGNIQSECKDSLASSYMRYMGYLKDVPAGQLVDGLDSFYDDYRNRLIELTFAVWLVSNEIAGTPEVETMIENWRRSTRDRRD